MGGNPATAAVSSAAMEHRIKQYPLEEGALEIQYIEEFFGEFNRKKTATEIVARLSGRPHSILMAEANLEDDPTHLAPVAFKVSHEIFVEEQEPKLKDLVTRLKSHVTFDGRRILYSWIGGTRRDWRGRGYFRALTEEQEAWAVQEGFDELVVKTKNKFYEMRGTLDHLHFNVIAYTRDSRDNRESKVYLSKQLGPDTLLAHRTERSLTVVRSVTPDA